MVYYSQYVYLSYLKLLAVLYYSQSASAIQEILQILSSFIFIKPNSKRHPSNS